MRARPALGACATRTGNAVNMLTDERRSNQLKKRHPGSDPGAASRCSSTYWPRTALRCARHCRLSARQSFRQSSQILRDAWMRAPSQPHITAQSPDEMPEHVYKLVSYGASLARS